MRLDPIPHFARGTVMYLCGQILPDARPQSCAVERMPSVMLTLASGNRNNACIQLSTPAAVHQDR